MKNKNTSKINPPINGEIKIFLRKGTALRNSKEEMVRCLKSAVSNNRIVGYNADWLHNGFLVIYYNELLDQGGVTATYVADQMVKYYNSHMEEN